MRGEERKRAGRNRTLSVTGEEVEQLRNLVSTLSDIERGENVLNKIIHADLLAIIDRIPNGFADLAIIDPPYNLTKDFHGMKFEAMDNGAYIGYLETWFYKVCEKLKPDGSLYLCGDWKSTSALQTVLERAGLSILNRITWQREKGRGARNNWKNGMEDIWFAVKDRKNYYFDVEAVKMRRRVIAPYRENGQPKDWECTEQGNFRSNLSFELLGRYKHTFLVYAREYRPSYTKAGEVVCQINFGFVGGGRCCFRPFYGERDGSRRSEKVEPELLRHRA